MIELITKNGRIKGVGEDGGYYTPSVDANGNLSWRASESNMPPVEAVNIKGPKGEDGVGIESITQGSQSDSDNGINTIHIHLTDGTNTYFTVRNGSKGEKGEDGTGLTSTAINLLLTILKNGVYITDQSANITALEAALNETGSDDVTPEEKNIEQVGSTLIIKSGVTATQNNNVLLIA